MAKKSNPLKNLILILTIIIALGAVVTIVTSLIQLGVINLGLEQIPNQVPPIAEIPFVEEDEGTETPTSEIPPPTTEELIDQFLRTLGVIRTETFGVDANVRLVDSNQEEVIQSSFLQVQPLDPREVIVLPEDEIDPSRLFINTDFSDQIADNGQNYHRFTGWDIVNEPSSCQRSGGIAFGCPIPVTVTTANCRVDNTEGKCVNVVGAKSDNDDVANASFIHGVQKKIDISDWTREGDLTFSFKYDCPTTLQRNMKIITTVRGDFGETFDVPCVSQGTFSREVSELVGNSNTLTLEIGTRATNVDNFRMDVHFNFVTLEGNSVVKREAIELLESLSIVQNDDEQRVLDLGFIELSLTGKTIEDNERVTVNGMLETRLNGKTVSTHVVSGNGVTSMNQIPLRVDGQNTFIFELNKQFFDPETFHILHFILNDFIVNVGEGEELRTFEYHTPFVAYTLEFNVLPDEIVAFNTMDQSISVPVSNTIFETCGTTRGEDPNNQPEVLPPEVSIIQNGFTIATTNPSAGKVQARDPFTGQEIPNTQFCSIIPELPTGTTLTFKIENQFFEVNVPTTQKTYFVRCNDAGCTSNIGYSS